MPSTRHYDSRSALWKAVADHVEACRLATGFTQKQFAKRCGISLDRYRHFIHQGAKISEEVAHRITRACFGEDFSRAKKVKFTSGKQDRSEKDIRLWWPNDDKRRLEEAAEKYGVSERTLVLIAVDQFLESSPPLNTVSRVAKAVSRAQATAELNDNPWLTGLLDLDPELVRIEDAERHKPVLPKDRAGTALQKIARTIPNRHEGGGMAEFIYDEGVDFEEV